MLSYTFILLQIKNTNTITWWATVQQPVWNMNKSIICKCCHHWDPLNWLNAKNLILTINCRFFWFWPQKNWNTLTFGIFCVIVNLILHIIWLISRSSHVMRGTHVRAQQHTFSRAHNIPSYLTRWDSSRWSRIISSDYRQVWQIFIIFRKTKARLLIMMTGF